jgi:DNA repair protein RecO (recombination protein O)
MPLLTTDALVLRTHALGETSKIVVLLTRERGKLRAVAKGARGARPRYRSSLEPLSEVRVGLHGRQGAELLRLGACELVRSVYRCGERGVGPALFLSYVAELLDAFSPEGEADDKVYRLALAVLQAVAGGADEEPLARYLEAWLLRLHGLYPPLEHCAACARALGRGPLRYHGASHGFVCDDCGPASGPVLVEPLRTLLGEIFRRAPAELAGPLPPEAKTLEAFHQDLITRHLERALRSHRVLRDVAREAGR